MLPPDHKRAVLGAITKAKKEQSSKRAICNILGCLKPAINSHSQQRGCALANIADRGKVYAKNSDILAKLSGKKEAFTLQPIGKATRFLGFCKEHDSSVFEDIEDAEIIPSDPKHQFLIFFRACYYELVNQYEYHSLMHLFYKHGKHLIHPRYSVIFEELEYYRTRLIEKDGPELQCKLNNALNSRDWTCIETRHCRIDRNIGISCATTMAPNEIILREYKRNKPESPMPFLSFSVIPEKQFTDVFYSTFQSHLWASASSFISLVGEKLIERVNFDALARSEDTCVNPSLWRRLTQDQKLTIERFVMSDNVDFEPGTLPLII